VRCGLFLEEGKQLKAGSKWMEALAKLASIRRIESEYKLDLPPSSRKQFEELESWAKGEREKDRKDREFGALLAELKFRVQQSEEKDTSARYVKLPELRDDFEALHKVWRSLTDFTRPIPEDSTAAFRKRSSLLETEITRRTAVRRRTILLTSATVLFVGAMVGWFVLGQIKAHDFAEHLQAAVSQRQVRLAEHMLGSLHATEPRLLRAASVAAVVPGAESFVTKERGLVTSFQSAFGKLPTHLGGEPEPASVGAIADQLVLTRTALNALAPDLKSENEPLVNAFERQWQQFLSESGNAVNRLLEQWIANAEEKSAHLDYRAPLEVAARQLADLSVMVQKISDCQAGFTNHMKLRNDLLQRAGAVRAKFAAYEGELKKIDDGMAALKKAGAYADFASAISLISSSEFSSAPAVIAASSIQSIGVSDEGTMRTLLGATNADTWAFINKRKSTLLIPEIAMPAERAFLLALLGDPAVSAGHQRYRLWFDRENTKSVEWITAGSLENSQGWKQIKAWTPSPSDSSAVFENRDYGYFDGQWKLSPTQPIYRLEQLGSVKVADSFGELNIGKVWSGGSTYERPALEILDAIKNSNNGSSVFRAFLFSRIIELMQFQPEAWGLSFCPSARTHAEEIRRIVGGEIVSGDWFVPVKVSKWSDQLTLFFATQKSLSYTKEATVNLALAQAAAKDGLKYVGFAGLDGKPVKAHNVLSAEMWGYDAVLRQPVLISDSAMPLSPLFALPAPRADYLVKAGGTADALAPANTLPLLFRPSAKQ
jgi:hypothetical protein